MEGLGWRLKYMAKTRTCTARTGEAERGKREMELERRKKSLACLVE